MRWSNGFVCPKCNGSNKYWLTEQKLIHCSSCGYQASVTGSAIEWIMERYQISTHKESGIKNNPNDWATEVGNPRYILDLLLSIINVSVQTVEIVNNLPNVDFGAEQNG